MISIFGYGFHGAVNPAFQTSEESVRIAEQIGDINSKSWAYYSYGFACYEKGFFDEAIEYISKGIFFGRRANLFVSGAIAEGVLGEIYFEIGEYQKADEHYTKAINLFRKNRSFPSWMNLYKMGSVKARVMKTEKVVDLGSLYGFLEGNHLKLHEGWMQRYLAEVLMNIDDQDLSEVQVLITKAAEADSRNNMIGFLGRDYILYAELFKRKGDKPKAVENLSKALDIFKNNGGNGWVEKYEKELSNL
jgi:tetratricopeptide (TPR) repeat protein